MATETSAKTPPPPPSPLSCTVCDVRVPGQVALEAHLKGARHARTLRSLQVVRQLGERGQLPAEVAATEGFRCRPCGVVLNSHIQLAAHLSGSKHMLSVCRGQIPSVAPSPLSGASSACSSRALNTEPENVARPVGHETGAALAAAGGGVAADARRPAHLQCTLCGVSANSPAQYQQHVQSSKHMTRAEVRGRGQALPYASPDSALVSGSSRPGRGGTWLGIGAGPSVVPGPPALSGYY